MKSILNLFTKQKKPKSIFDLSIKELNKYSKKTFTREIAKNVFFVAFWKSYHLQKEKGLHIQDTWRKFKIKEEL